MGLPARDDRQLNRHQTTLLKMAGTKDQTIKTKQMEEAS
jgi:hypothetical protein